MLHSYLCDLPSDNFMCFSTSKRCATNRKVAGSIPAGVSGFFIDIESFRSHYGLGSTQPQTEMSTRSISGDKGGRCVRLTTYHHPVPLSRNLRALILACNGTDCFTFFLPHQNVCSFQAACSAYHNCITVLKPTL